ncbi:MAG: hypothetical protein R2764_03280 [Bacteroidales bacterium]
MVAEKDKWKENIKSSLYIGLYVAVLLMLLMLITTSTSKLNKPLMEDKYETTLK